MKCTLDGNNARVIAKAIQSLSKFGTELFIEADQQGLQLRTLNSTRSAVGTIRFNRIFFRTYRQGNNDSCNVHVAMKACFNIFRNMKQVEQCEMCFVGEKFQVQLQCKLEIVKTALISIVDEETITSEMTPSDATNVICGRPKTFIDVSNNFNALHEEITLKAENNSLTAKNYTDDARVNNKFMRTQLTLATDEFDVFQVVSDTSITFCLKEFRAFLHFAAALDEEVELKFDDAGSPLFVLINKADQIQCTLIMSTLAPEDVSFYNDHRRSFVNAPNTTNCETRAAAPSKRKNSTKNNSSKVAKELKQNIAQESTISNDSVLFQFNDSVAASTDTNTAGSVQTPRLIDNELEDDDIILAAEANIAASKPESEIAVIFYNTEDIRQPEALAIENNDECLPESPNRVHIRSIFARCFQSTYVPPEPSPNSEVYVPHSDTED